MQLKGNVLERLPADKRARMEKTLERMNEVRRTSDMRLAQIIKAKKDWAEKERQKGLDVIEELEKQKEEIVKNIADQQEQVREQIITLDGCLLVLNELNEEADILIKADQAKEEN
jgi:hypothetical protein